MGPDYSSLLFIFNFCLFLAVLGLHRFMWAFSSCSKHGRYPVLCCVALLLQSRDSRYGASVVVAVGPGAGSGVVAVGPGAGSGVVAVGPGAGF